MSAADSILAALRVGPLVKRKGWGGHWVFARRRIFNAVDVRALLDRGEAVRIGDEVRQTKDRCRDALPIGTDAHEDGSRSCLPSNRELPPSGSGGVSKLFRADNLNPKAPQLG